MRRRTPFLQNQHPSRVYNEPPRSSKQGLNHSIVLKSDAPKKPSICSLFSTVATALGLPQSSSVPNVGGGVTQVQPSVIKLFTSNPVSVGGTAIQVMLPNPNRTGFRITNVGTTIIYIGLGKPVQIPSLVQYDHVLPGCTVAHDGTGGVITDDIFQGACWVISSGPAGLIALVEEP
jgi:hypothetical protein